MINKYDPHTVRTKLDVMVHKVSKVFIWQIRHYLRVEEPVLTLVHAGVRGQPGDLGYRRRHRSRLDHLGLGRVFVFP